MGFMDWIVTRLVNISDFFYIAYKEVHSWWFPFDSLAEPLYWLYRRFDDLALHFFKFGKWVENTTNKIAQFFTGLELEAWFKDWKQKILDAWNWVKDGWKNVTQIVSDWWSTVVIIVKGWIDIAKQWAGELINSVNRWLGSLQSAWDNFTKSILPKLASWTGISSLINATLKEWFPWYDTLAELWGDISKFFISPFDFLFSKFEDWFWGGDEK